MSVSFNTIGEVTATFKADDTVAVGDLVAIKTDGEVKKTALNDEIVGVCVSKNGAYVGVQIKGGVKVACDTSLVTGYKAIKSTADNKVALATSGCPHLVCEVSGGFATIIL